MLLLLHPKLSTWQGPALPERNHQVRMASIYQELPVNISKQIKSSNIANFFSISFPIEKNHMKIPLAQTDASKVKGK